MRRARITSQAETDVSDAALWYESRLEGLGAEFLLELDATVIRISEWPLSFPEVAGGARRAIMRHFPFSVYFRVTGEITEIVAVLHQHRDPRVWESRLVID